MTAEEEAKAQKTLAARKREREQKKLRMRWVREAQRVAKEVDKVSAPAGALAARLCYTSSQVQFDKLGFVKV